MILWKKFCWKHCTSYVKVSKIVVTFELKSESGHVLISEKKEFTPDKLMVVKDYWRDIWDNQHKLSVEGKDKYNLVAKQLLQDYRKLGGFVDKKSGVLIKGLHFVDCTWYLNYDSESLTFDEYLDLWGKKNE